MSGEETMYNKWSEEALRALLSPPPRERRHTLPLFLEVENQHWERMAQQEKTLAEIVERLDKTDAVIICCKNSDQVCRIAASTSGPVVLYADAGAVGAVTRTQALIQATGRECHIGQ